MPLLWCPEIKHFQKRRCKQTTLKPLFCISFSCLLFQIRSMTTYGTISTQAQASSSLSLLGRAKEQILLCLGSGRPWLELIQCDAFGLPTSFGEATDRIKANILFFRVNYTIITSIALFISLLWQPVSLIIFLVLIILWLFLYFRDNEPLMIFGRMINDSTVKMVLFILTICMFLVTDVFHGVLVGFLAVSPIILVHSVCRNKEPLFMAEDDEEAVSSKGASSLASFS